MKISEYSLDPGGIPNSAPSLTTVSSFMQNARTKSWWLQVRRRLPSCQAQAACRTNETNTAQADRMNTVVEAASGVFEIHLQRTASDSASNRTLQS